MARGLPRTAWQGSPGRGKLHPFIFRKPEWAPCHSVTSPHLLTVSVSVYPAVSKGKPLEIKGVVMGARAGVCVCAHSGGQSRGAGVGVGKEPS